MDVNVLSVVKIGEHSASPGEKFYGFLDAGSTSINTYRVPLAIINGSASGKTVGIIGGTHGTEFASIEAVIKSIKVLNPKNMRGTVLAVPVLNGPQFEHKSAFLSPFDQLNLNRVFPGDQKGTLSQQIAYTVFDKVVSRCDALMDCHGGDINEDIWGFVLAGEGENKDVNMVALDMASCFTTKAVTLYPVSRQGLTMCAQAIYNIPCITPEAGTPYPVRESQISFHYDGIMNVLKYFGVIEGEARMVKPVINPRSHRIKAEEGGIWRPNVEVEQTVKTGEELGSVTDLFGNVKQVVKAPEDGIVSMTRCFYSVNSGELLISLSVLG